MAKDRRRTRFQEENLLLEGGECPRGEEEEVLHEQEEEEARLLHALQS